MQQATSHYVTPEPYAAAGEAKTDTADAVRLGIGLRAVGF